MKLFIAEYVRLSSMAPMPEGSPLATQVVPIGEASAVSAKFNVATRVIRLSALSSCSVVIRRADENPVATANDLFLFGGQTEYFGVEEGGRFAVAVIANDEVDHD